MKRSKSREFVFHGDSRYSWLKVKIETVFALGIEKQISPLSKMTSFYAFLARDNDAPLFISTMQRRMKDGHQIVLKFSVSKNPSRLRTYPSWDLEAIDRERCAVKLMGHTPRTSIRSILHNHA